MKHVHLYCQKGRNFTGNWIGDCKIAVYIANGDLVNLILHDVLYVPEALWNLLSCSQLSQDHFQIVQPADNSVYCPRIYNCCKNKTSVEHWNQFHWNWNISSL